MIFYGQKTEGDLVWLPFSGELSGIFPNIPNVSRISIIGSETDILQEEEAAQYGYLMFDIDDSDLTRALESGRELVQKLITSGIRTEDFQVELSGSKGVHIYIKPDVFGVTTPVPYLALVYAKMAKHFIVPGMDFQIYNMKKGRLVRPTNSLRPDGNYKVKVTLEELAGLTEESYIELVRQPRDLDNISGSGQEVPELRDLFDGFRTSVASSILMAHHAREASDDDFSSVKIVGDSAPSCVTSMLKGEIKPGTPFNSVHYPLTIYAKHKNLSDSERKSVFKQAAATCNSEKNVNIHERLAKAEDSYSRLPAKMPDPWGIFCNSMRKHLKVSPACSDCKFLDSPVTETFTTEEGNEKPLTMPDIEELSGIKITKKGFATKANDRLISNFYIELLGTYISEADESVILGYRVNVFLPRFGRVKTLDNLPVSAWINKKSFCEALGQVEGARFEGGEPELQKVRDFVLYCAKLTGKRPKNIIPTKKSGMRVRSVDIGFSKYRSVAWVQEGFSIDQNGLIGTYSLSTGETNRSVPDIRKDIDPFKLHEAFGAFKALWNINSPDVMSGIIAYMFYSHISQQLTMTNDSALVSMFISAESGSGKTAALGKALTLFGYSVAQAESIKSSGSLGGGATMASIRSMAGSSTAPLVVNEMNKKSMDEKVYRDMLEIIKSTFDRAAMSKCNAHGKGVDITQIESPLILVSEEPLHQAAVGYAVIDRLVRISLVKRECLKRQEEWDILAAYPDVCSELGRALITMSLSTSVDDICAMFYETSKLMANVSTSRQATVYAKLMTGVTWAKVMFERLGADSTVMEIMSKIESGVESLWVKSGHEAKQVLSTSTESILNFLDAIGSKKDIAGVVAMKVNVDYKVTADGNTIAVDMVALFPYYAAYMKSLGKTEPYRSMAVALTSIQSSEYFLSPHVHPELLLSETRSVAFFDIARLRADGLTVLNL